MLYFQMCDRLISRGSQYKNCLDPSHRFLAKSIGRVPLLRDMNATQWSLPAFQGGRTLPTTTQQGGWCCPSTEMFQMSHYCNIVLCTVHNEVRQLGHSALVTVHNKVQKICKPQWHRSVKTALTTIFPVTMSTLTMRNFHNSSFEYLTLWVRTLLQNVHK